MAVSRRNTETVDPDRHGKDGRLRPVVCDPRFGGLSASGRVTMIITSSGTVSWTWGMLTLLTIMMVMVIILVVA